MTNPIFIEQSNAQCGTVAFKRSDGEQPHVPLFVLPITITEPGILLDIDGRFVLSSRRDDSQNYPGFPHPYFAAGGIFLTAQDPTQLVDVPLSSGFLIDKDAGDDGFPGGGTDTSPMKPYVTEPWDGRYVTTQADVGQRWIVLLAWCSSGYATISDYLLNEAMEGFVNVVATPGVTQIMIGAPAAPIVLSPPPPPPPVAPPSPPPPPPPASGFDFQALWRRLLGK